jgi:hypothetical protein
MLFGGIASTVIDLKLGLKATGTSDFCCIYSSEVIPSLKMFIDWRITCGYKRNLEGLD